MYLVIGAGLAGCVIANRIAALLNVAGNIFDYKNSDGIFVQKYGPHIFHTNYAHVWNYLCQFTNWFPYNHIVKARIKSNRKARPGTINPPIACVIPAM